MTTGFVDTSTNMVRVVQNAIESYGMGPMRALAQEPVQNSKDAKSQSRVRVEYRPLTRQSREGSPYSLLTVTDQGTTGLQGPILSKEEREARGLELGQGENWAAFEGQGFTRKEENAIGSRGQGKSAFLYHSRPTDSAGNQLDRYLMLYDTFLENGEYRFGVRYAMPADRVKEPPPLNDAARQALSGDYDIGDGTVISLRLNPLIETGTRVIVPYLSEEALSAIRTHELHRWLQRCWWRAIQIKDLEITVVNDEGRSEPIQVPSWWKDKPWENGDNRVTVRKNVSIDGGLKIKRIVLLYDENLQEDEIDGYGTQYGGVQLLRGQQWIETLDVRDLIPVERRPGFRGFAEFEIALERELKNTEKPQHESFDGRNPLVKQVRAMVSSAVKKFAEERGWISEAETRDAPERERELATEFLSVFASGAGSSRRRPRSGRRELAVEERLTWTCGLGLDYPTAKSSRLNWGQFMNNVSVSVQCEPPQPTGQVDVSLELTREGESASVEVDQREDVQLQEGIDIAEFGNFQIARGRASAGKIQVPEPGKWELRAKVMYGGAQVASAMRRLYVEIDPPDAPLPKPYTLSVSVRNLSRDGQRRINNGDEIGVQVTVTNRAADGTTLRLDASLADRLLAGSREVTLDGVPAGDVPSRRAAVSERLRVYTSPPLTLEPHIVLQPGRYYLRADLLEPGVEEPIAHASQPVYVEVDPGGNRTQLPFELEAVEGEGPNAMWQLQERSADEWVLSYANRYPLYLHLAQPQRRRSKLAGRSSFIAEVCANGLLEWALAPLDTSDSTRIEHLRQSRARGINTRRWDAYCERIDRLEENYNTERVGNFSRYMKRWRECVADMLNIFEATA